MLDRVWNGWKSAKTEKPPMGSTVLGIDSCGIYEIVDYCILDDALEEEPHFYRWVKHFNDYLDDWECADNRIELWTELPPCEGRMEI